MNRPIHQPLKTKLIIPQVRPALIHRQRLIARITAGTQNALTLISAPAGFGKTTLLAEWAAQNLLPVAWISLEGEDNDPARFVTCLLLAFERIQVLQPATLALIQTPDALPARSLLEDILSDLEIAPNRACLVLDDYHLIHNQAVHDLLTYLLDHLPPQLHLVISTRADPPVRLARLRARGEITELRAEDLRFRAEEANAFFEHVMGLRLNPADAAALDLRTEGWIAGMQLAALSMQGRKDTSAFIQAFSGSHRYILDYLLEEVLNHQPENIHRFLLQTSILEQLSAPLCDLVTGAQGASQILLESLERNNLFLIPLDNERRWYRYHHLFADLLRARLQQFSPELIPTLHLRAAAWLDQNGFPLAAVQHALAAQDNELAAELIERHVDERWSISDLTFLGLLGRLPAENLHNHPTLGIYLAWTHVIYGRLKEGQDLLQRLVQHLPDHGGPVVEGMRGFCAMLFAYIHTLTGTTQEIHLPDRAVLDFIPEQFLAMRNSADVIYARLLAYQGRFEEAAEILFSAVRRDIGAGGTTAAPISIAMIARLRIIQGQLHAAAALCNEYLELITARNRQRFYIAGNLSLMLAEVFYEWNDLVQAELLVREGIRNNEAWNIPQASAFGCMTLAQIQLAQENLAGATESIRQAEAAVAGRTVPFDQINELRILRLKLEMAHGQQPTSQTWAEHLPMNFPQDYRWELDTIILAQLLISEQKYTQALSLLEQLKQQAEVGKRNGRLIKICLLQAKALLALGQQSQAFAALQTSLDFAEPEGYLRSFLEEGETVRDLLDAYLRAPGSSHRAYILRILETFSPHRSLPNSGLIEPLTVRELDVLNCLNAGDSNQDIAAKLFISVSAVKKHTGNIYGKLGVSSRTQAVARARGLGLLPA